MTETTISQIELGGDSEFPQFNHGPSLSSQEQSAVAFLEKNLKSHFPRDFELYFTKYRDQIITTARKLTQVDGRSPNIMDTIAGVTKDLEEAVCSNLNIKLSNLDKLPRWIEYIRHATFEALVDIRFNQ